MTVSRIFKNFLRDALRNTYLTMSTSQVWYHNMYEEEFRDISH